MLLKGLGLNSIVKLASIVAYCDTLRHSPKVLCFYSTLPYRDILTVSSVFSTLGIAIAIIPVVSLETVFIVYWNERKIKWLFKIRHARGLRMM